MFIPEPYFENVPAVGDLKFEYDIFSDSLPILFLCKAKDRWFICVCRTFIPEQMWVISEVDIPTIRELADGKISVPEAFCRLGRFACKAFWRSDNPTVRYEPIDPLELGQEDLPDADLYLDDDDKECIYDQFGW